jgi:hypothetical protein
MRGWFAFGFSRDAIESLGAHAPTAPQIAILTRDVGVPSFSAVISGPHSKSHAAVRHIIDAITRGVAPASTM